VWLVKIVSSGHWSGDHAHPCDNFTALVNVRRSTLRHVMSHSPWARFPSKRIRLRCVRWRCVRCVWMKTGLETILQYNAALDTVFLCERCTDGAQLFNRRTSANVIDPGRQSFRLSHTLPLSRLRSFRIFLRRSRHRRTRFSVIIA